jgi:hypothetical protein
MTFEHNLCLKAIREMKIRLDTAVSDIQQYRLKYHSAVKEKVD